MIEEPKIAGLTPVWAGFPGFSILFDAPTSAFRPGDGIDWLACDVEGDPALEFYRRVARGFQSLNPSLLLQTYGLCALPPDSFHVTAFDVANVADLTRCHAAVRDEIHGTLRDLPRSILARYPLLNRAKAFEIEPQAFRYGELRTGGRGVVVRLEPVDLEAFRRFMEARAGLSRGYRDEYGVGAGEAYGPHLSLGYFASTEGAELARTHLGEWNEAIRCSVGDETLSFPTASLYGFTDMATFFRAA